MKQKWLQRIFNIRFWIVMSLSVFFSQPIAAYSQFNEPKPDSLEVEYRILATSRTSTMQKEMNEAADAGFRFEGVMGGETAIGGNEAVVAMSRILTGDHKIRYEYKLLATTKTSTMQKEMQQAGDAGFEYRGQSVFKTAFGGKEVVVIMERERDAKINRYEYKLLATTKTSTMQKEMMEAGRAGFCFVGITVSETALGGKELVVILRRNVQRSL